MIPAETLELRIIGYLDGSLAAEDRAQFDRELAADAALREVVELQRFVDASIRRLYVPKVQSLPEDLLNAPANTQADGSIAGVISAGASAELSARPLWAKPGIRRWLAYAVAACVLLTTAFFVNREVLRRNPDFKLVSADSLYALLQRRGWKPEQVCTTEKEFGDLVNSRLGQPLFPTETIGVTLLGWGYSQDYDGTPISPKTVVLLTKVDDREVMVLLDRVSRDREVKLSSLPPNSPLSPGPLHVHRRVVGDLVLYEVSPFHEPRVLPTLRQK